MKKEIKEKAFGEMVEIYISEINKLKPKVLMDSEGYLHLDSNPTNFSESDIVSKVSIKFKLSNNETDSLGQLRTKAIRQACKKVGFNFNGYDF